MNEADLLSNRYITTAYKIVKACIMTLNVQTTRFLRALNINGFMQKVHLKEKKKKIGLFLKRPPTDPINGLYTTSCICMNQEVWFLILFYIN